MPLYDGVISMNEGDVGVIVAIEDDRVRLSVGTSEIGEWDVDDCHIQRVDEGVFSISAEDEALRFVPNQPQLFQQAVGSRISPPRASEPVAPTTSGSGAVGATPSGRVIMIVSAGIAGALGVWALLSLI